MGTTHILGLRTTIYKVGEMSTAKQWYTKAFGVEPYFEEDFYIGFNVGGFELGLQPEESSAIAKRDSVFAYWGVDHIQQVFDHMLSLGATENEKPFNVGGELMTATVKDPWGNVIGFIYNPSFKLQEGNNS